MLNDLDWDLVRVFLTVAQTGSLTRAAGALRSSQPTVGRQVAQLEEQLGVPLVVRSPRGIALTAAGRELAASGVRVADGMNDLVRHVRGEAGVVRGTVRITASEPIAVYVMPPILSALRVEHPAIEIELISDNRSSDLLSGDADIAARMFVPEQLDLVRKRIGDIPTGLYASPSYLERRGILETFDDIFDDGHVLIGFDRDPWASRAYTSVDPRMTPDRFAFRSDSLLVQLEAARAGVGIIPMQVAIAERGGSLVRILPAFDLPTLPLWLAMHRDVRGSAAVRATFGVLAEGLRRHIEGKS